MAAWASVKASRSKRRIFPPASPGFFGGCTEHTHAQTHLVRNFCRGNPRADRGCGDDIMAAGMSDAGQDSHIRRRW